MAINLGSIGKKTAAKGKAELPEYPMTEDVLQLANELAEWAEKADIAAAQKEIIQAKLKEKFRPFVFEYNHGRAAVDATVSFKGPGREILAALKDAYITTESLDEVQAILGEQRTGKLFKQKFEIKIDSSKIPEDMQQDVVDKLINVMGEFNCTDALSARSSFKPTKAFASERHQTITVEENLQLEQINGGKGLTVISVAPARGRK